MQSMHSQEKHRNPHAYLRVHCVAFKYNCADLYRACYSVKLQGGTIKQIFRGVMGNQGILLTEGRSGRRTELEWCLEHNSGQDL